MIESEEKFQNRFESTNEDGKPSQVLSPKIGDAGRVANTVTSPRVRAGNRANNYGLSEKTNHFSYTEESLERKTFS